MSRPPDAAPRRALPPSVARRARGNRAALALVRRFYEAGHLAPVDVHTVDALARLGGEDRPEVLLALALAVRAPRHGHVGEDLEEAVARRPRADDATASAPPWPTEYAAWRAAVASSPLVRVVEPGAGVQGGVAGAGPTPFVLSGALLMMERYHGYQRRLAAALKARAGIALTVGDPGLFRRGLAALFPAPGEAEPLDRQRLAAVTASLRGLTVISGGPGTGKTSTIRRLLVLLFAQWAAARGGRGDAHEPLRVALAAPTGKAAARMKESLDQGLEAFVPQALAALGGHAGEDAIRGFLAELTPSTLHRLLGYRRDRPTRFRHDADDPVPYDVVLVDETSMVDLALMAKLVAAVPRQARLVLLGDRHQLASVEAGSVLADLMRGAGSEGDRLRLSPGLLAEVAQATGEDWRGRVEVAPGGELGDCVVQLVRSYRFTAASGIGTFARASLAAARRGPAEALSVLQGGAFADVRLLPHGATGGLGADVARAIVEGYRPYLELLARGPAPGQDAESFQREVLAAFDGFRVLCAHRRGPWGVEDLNERVRALLAARTGLVPARGTHYEGCPVLVTENDYTVRRFNGDVGVTVRGPEGRLQVAFPEAGGGVTCLAPARLPPHEVVFAMTIHKSQGSEVGHAMVVLPARPSPILTCELVYTGVTRARHRMTMVGDPAILEHALTRRIARASGLADELRG